MQVIFYSITDLFWQLFPVIAVVGAALLYWLIVALERERAKPGEYEEYDWDAWYTKTFDHYPKGVGRRD